MKNYLELLSEVLEHGLRKPDRTGTGVLSVFGKQLRFDLGLSFPLLTTKKVYFKGIVHELLWFLQGSDNIAYLNSKNINIWNEWADENGNVGPIYGYQWRKWKNYDGTYTDQIGNLIKSLRENPHSRRHIVSAWNVGQLDQMSIPPCHCLFQFYVGSDNKLSCHLYQRSADIFLGTPFNIASYALLTSMIAQCCDLTASELIISFGDLHLYLNHIEQAKQQLQRKPRLTPSLSLNEDIKDIFIFEAEDISIIDYKPHPVIKATISV